MSTGVTLDPAGGGEKEDGYLRALESLWAARRQGVDLSLHRVADAVAALEHGPRWVVQIGGTNGKGSTAAMVAACLSAAGVSAGLYTSPHLSRFTERFRIDGREVSRDAVADAFREWSAKSCWDALTFFERATVLAWDLFGLARVDVGVFEVGLGGRGDATTALRRDVAAVTGVALDHQEFLGPTIQHIAREKAGVAAAGLPVVVGYAGDPAGRPAIVAEILRRGGVVREPSWLPAGAQMRLAGEVQRGNAAVAMGVLDALAEVSLGAVVVDAEARRAGLADVTWPGRLESLMVPFRGRVVSVWLDGAHNPDAAAQLGLELASRTRAPGLLFGVVSDKDAAGMLAPLTQRAPFVVLTEPPTPRARAAQSLSVWANADAQVVPDWETALDRALDAAASSGNDLLVAGSLFLVGAVRARLLSEEVDPLVVSDPVKVGSD